MNNLKPIPRRKSFLSRIEKEDGGRGMRHQTQQNEQVLNWQKKNTPSRRNGNKSLIVIIFFFDVNEP